LMGEGHIFNIMENIDNIDLDQIFNNIPPYKYSHYFKDIY